VLLKDVSAGTVLNDKLIGIKRPGTGMSPKYFDWVLGKKINCDLKKDQILSIEDLA
jgi:sialic acid synthase SpsE